MASVLVSESDLTRLFMSIEQLFNSLTVEGRESLSYELAVMNCFKLQYGDLVDARKQARTWYSAYKQMTGLQNSSESYSQYLASKRECNLILKKIDETKDKYFIY